MLKRSLTLILTLVVCLTALARTPRPVTDMAIPAPGGKKIDLRQYHGKVVLLAMITPTCAECLKSLELFKTLQKDFGPYGFQMVVAVVNANAQADAGPFADRYKLPFPVGYLDHVGFMKVADVAADRKPYVPIVLFIDRDGVVQFQYFGNDTVMKDEEKNLRGITYGLVKQRPKQQ